MTWRFRKSFKIMPGVKLNLTRNGLSATVGVAPLSLNVGPRGVYANVSVPGTGVWNRVRLDGSSPHSSAVQTPLNPGDNTAPFPVSTEPPPITPPVNEIRSASTQSLGSGHLEQLRQLLTETYNEREDIGRELSKAEREADVAVKRYWGWERGFLLKRLFKKAFAVRKENLDTAVAKRDELQEQLRLTALDTEITVDRAQAEPYYRMRDAFSALAECRKIWHTLTVHSVNRAVERSACDIAFTREPVTFSLDTCDLISWDQKVPHLSNRTGGDIFIYPGFILYRASKEAFALIDAHEVAITYSDSRFQEREGVPTDSAVIGQTWAKSNKDGSPDRRFRDNYQIPMVLYGALLFTSPGGLHEAYNCSNHVLTKNFAKAWSDFRMSLLPIAPVRYSGWDDQS